MINGVGRDVKQPSEMEVAQAVRALAELNLEALRSAWRERLGSPPPPLRSPDHLRRLLAWRLQAEVLGGLEPQTRRHLALSGAAAVAPQLPVGARVSREWHGAAHEVEVTPEGLLYRGKLHRSLSEVARAITGVRWNGPRFFGLRSEGA